MGYRCPKCKLDFGSNQKKFNQHFLDNDECNKFA